MRTVGKILAAPFVVVLTLLWAVLVFVFSWAQTVLNFTSGLVALLAIILLITGQITGGIVFAVVAFLISPVGIPAIAEWLIDRLCDMNNALKNFIAT